MAYMKFYVGNEANAQSYKDGIYLAVDTKKIYYNGNAYGGEEVDLSNYVTLDGIQSITGIKYFYSPVYIEDVLYLGGNVLHFNGSNRFIDNQNFPGITSKTSLSLRSKINDNENLFLDSTEGIAIVSGGNFDPGNFDPRILIRNWNRNYVDLGAGSLKILEKANSATKFVELTPDGVTLSDKTSSDLLHAAGGTISIDELKEQIGGDNVYVIDYLDVNGGVNGGTITEEQLNDLKAAIENNKIIIFRNSHNSLLVIYTYSNETQISLILLEGSIAGSIIINTTNYSYQVEEFILIGFTDTSLGTKGQVLTKTDAGYGYAWQDPQTYTLPIASPTQLGGIRVGDGLEVTPEGVLNCTIDPGSGTVSWGNIQGKPTFATVATSGSYNDLTDKPSIPDISGLATKEELGNYLPLSGGTVTGAIISKSYVHVEDNEGYYTDISGLDGITVDNGKNEKYHSLVQISTGDVGPSKGPVVAIREGSSYSTFNLSGIIISGKTTSDLLNAGGSTTPISDLVTQVQAAIVNGAPETLDTLNELAAALGDDPNFATTVTNQIASKADKDHTHTISQLSDLNSAWVGMLKIAPTYLMAGNSASETTVPVIRADNGSTQGYLLKEDVGVATSGSGGFMSSEDKDNLDNVVNLIKAGFFDGIADFTPSSDKVTLTLTLSSGLGDTHDTTDKAVDIPAATTSNAGVMTAADKKKLNDYPEYSELLASLGVVSVAMTPNIGTIVTEACLMTTVGVPLILGRKSDGNYALGFGTIGSGSILPNINNFSDICMCGTGNSVLSGEYASILSSTSGSGITFKDVIIKDTNRDCYWVPTANKQALHQCSTLIEAITYKITSQLS